MSYLFGYNGQRKSLAQMMQTNTWSKVQPEVRRRSIAMMDDCPYDLGVGGGWRDSSLQEATFYQRTYEVSCSGSHKYTYKGKCYNLKSGMAPTAPPGLSYHESTDPFGYALAIDFLNYMPAIGWLNEHCHDYDLKHFGDVNGERWHVQPVEIPNARRNYRPNIHTIRYWNAPIPPSPPVSTVIGVDEMIRAAKNKDNGNAYMYSFPPHSHAVAIGSDQKLMQLVAAAGMIDVASGNVVASWAAVGAVDAGTVRRYVGSF